MDWKVKVITKNDYMKDVIVYDYPYPSDATDAAMAQTDAKSFISCEPYFQKTDSFTSSDYSSPTNYNSSYSANELTGFEGILLIIAALTLVFAFPVSMTLFCILIVSIIIRLIKKSL